jgi:hypothetical protein
LGLRVDDVVIQYAVDRLNGIVGWLAFLVQRSWIGLGRGRGWLLTW